MKKMTNQESKKYLDSKKEGLLLSILDLIIEPLKEADKENKQIAQEEAWIYLVCILEEINSAAFLYFLNAVIEFKEDDSEEKQYELKKSLIRDAMKFLNETIGKRFNYFLEEPKE